MTTPDGNRGPDNANFEEQRNRALAKELAGRQDQLVQAAIKLSEDDYDHFDYHGGYRDDEWGVLWYGTQSTIQGTHDVNLLLAHTFDDTKTLREKVGVNTTTRIDVGIYTDRATWEAVRRHQAYDWEAVFGLTLDEVKEAAADLFTPEEIDDCTFPSPAGDNYGTYYFVDYEGNYAKVISIPDDLADELAPGQEDLEIEGHAIGGVITIKVPMTARDFVVMKLALQELKEGLQRVSTEKRRPQTRR